MWLLGIELLLILQKEEMGGRYDVTSAILECAGISPLPRPPLVFYRSFLFFSFLSFFLSVCLSFCLFRATPVAYGGSQSRGSIRTAAAGLHHSHSNMGSELRLRPTSQLMAMPDP